MKYERNERSLDAYVIQVKVSGPGIHRDFTVGFTGISFHIYSVKLDLFLCRMNMEKRKRSCVSN